MVEWVGVGTERLPVFYNAKLRLMDEFHDYVCYVAETEAKIGTLLAALRACHGRRQRERSRGYGGC